MNVLMGSTKKLLEFSGIIHAWTQGFLSLTSGR
jgi:hypothetical protein